MSLVRARIELELKVINAMLREEEDDTSELYADLVEQGMVFEELLELLEIDAAIRN